MSWDLTNVDSGIWLCSFERWPLHYSSL